MEKVTVDQLVGRVYALLGERLGVRGATLEDRVRKAGRALPAPVRRAAGELVSAEQMAREPKMLRHLDPAHISAAYEICIKHLDGVDTSALRSKARFGLAATIIVQIGVVLGVTLGVLSWRGFF